MSSPASPAPPGIVRTPSICRFCHANCGILVDVAEGRPVRVTGDPDNPAYHGFTCAKGRRLADQHAHPDRLLTSRRRRADGGYEAISSERAMDEVAARVSALIAEHGPRSVAIYVGTHAGPHPATIPFAVSWLVKAGSPMVFTASTIDQPGKHVANAIHGRWLGGSYVFDEADTWMLVGNNPLISMSGGIPPSNPGRRLREARRRGQTLIVIDPRKTEVARHADLFLQPRPGEDPAVLAAMLHVVFREARVDGAFIDAHVAGARALASAVEPFTPEWAEARADVPAADIEAAARLFSAAERCCGVAGTGPNMAPHGNLTEYLLLALNTVCGHWRRAGDTVPNPGALLPRATPKAQALAPRAGWGRGERLRSRPLGNSAAGLPTAALADEILHEGDDRVRALICVGSNPVAAWPDQLKTVEAMDRLELLVCLDMKMAATARRAHYVIAPKLSLEVPGISVSSEAIEQTYVGIGYPEPYAQYTPARARPPEGADVIEEWEFFYGLAQRMGLELALFPVRPETGALRERRETVAVDMEKKPTTDDVFEMLMNGSRIPLAEVRRHPHGHVFDDEEITVAPADPDVEDRLDVGNPAMLEELAGVYGASPDATAADFPFRLISRRMPNVYNSSGRDIARLQKDRPYNPAYMHPADLEALGIDPGETIEIASDRATIVAVAARAPELRPGLVSMAHCFGDAPDQEADPRRHGSSTGRLIDNTRHFDPYTGIPRMSAIPVAVRRQP